MRLEAVADSVGSGAGSVGDGDRQSGVFQDFE